MTPEELRLLLRKPEGLKLDFKREYKLNAEPPTGTNKQKWKQYSDGQWDEFIKDILALTNGNVGTAHQAGQLVIGAGDELLPDGIRPLYDSKDLRLTRRQVLEKVNSACAPPIPDLQCDAVELDGKTLWVITIPPSPHVHETTRELRTTKGEFDDSGQLRHVQDKPITKSTVFIRRNDGIYPATEAERQALRNDKSSNLVARRLHQLPADLPDFAGRAGTVADIEQLIASTRRVLIVGMGGIGKSALVVHVAHRIKHNFPDGQLYLDLRGTGDSSLSASEALIRLLRAVHPGRELPKDEAELAILFRSEMHDKRMLIVLDDAAGRAQVSPLLVSEPGIAVLITSRRAFPLPGLGHLRLDTFTPDESRAFLVSLCPRLQVELEPVDEIAQLCGHLPLALRAAGSLLAISDDLDGATYARRLRTKYRRLERIGAEGVDVSVEASLGLSYAHLGKDSARVFRKLAVFASSFYAQAEEYICEDPDHTHLSELLRCSLIEWDRDSCRYWLHDLVRVFARSRLEPREWDFVQQRYAAHYAEVVDRIGTLYSEGAEAVKYAVQLFDIEWRNIEAGQTWTARHSKDSDTAATLCITYALEAPYILDLRLQPEVRLRWLRPALAAARRHHDLSAQNSILGDLGQAYLHLGETQRAIQCYERQLAIARKDDDLHNMGVALSNLGIAYSYLGDCHRAAAYHEQHLAIARQIGDRQGEGVALGNLGNARMGLGEISGAVKLYQQDLAIAREVGDLVGQGAVLDSLGRAYLHLGDFAHAIECCEQAVTILREIGDRGGEANALMNLGHAHGESGNLYRAVELGEQALQMFHKLDQRGSEASVLVGASLSYTGLGETDRAEAYCEQALAIFRETGSRDGEAAALGNWGVACTAKGEMNRALDLHAQSLQIYREIGARNDEGEELWHMSHAFEKLGDYAQAIAHTESALVIWEQTRDYRTGKARAQLVEWRQQMNTSLNSAI